MKVTVAPMWEFNRNKDKYTKIISITEEDRPVGSLGGHHLVLKLWDCVSDTEYQGKHLTPPSKEECMKAIVFAKTWSEDDNVLIHCAAGISRSPAIAFGVLWDRYRDEETVLRTLDHIAVVRKPNLAIMKIWSEVFPDFPFYGAGGLIGGEYVT